jgi:hypothetical protein
VELTACLLVAAVVTAVVAHLARNVWMLYPDNLEPAVYLWAGAGVFAVNLTVTRVVTERKVGRAVVGLTAAVVVVAACSQPGQHHLRRVRDAARRVAHGAP